MLCYLCDERAYGRQVRFDECCREGVPGGGGIFLMRPSTSICVTIAKVLKRAGCGQADNKDGAGEPERSVGIDLNF